MGLKKRQSDFIAVPDFTEVGNTRVTREEIDVLREKTIRLVYINPQKAATILSAWLNIAQTGGKRIGQNKKSRLGPV